MAAGGGGGGGQGGGGPRGGDGGRPATRFDGQGGGNGSGGNPGTHGEPCGAGATVADLRAGYEGESGPGGSLAGAGGGGGGGCRSGTGSGGNGGAHFLGGGGGAIGGSSASAGFTNVRSVSDRRDNGAVTITFYRAAAVEVHSVGSLGVLERVVPPQAFAVEVAVEGHAKTAAGGGVAWSYHPVGSGTSAVTAGSRITLASGPGVGCNGGAGDTGRPSQGSFGVGASEPGLACSYATSTPVGGASTLLAVGGGEGGRGGRTLTGSVGGTLVEARGGRGGYGAAGGEAGETVTNGVGGSLRGIGGGGGSCANPTFRAGGSGGRQGPETGAAGGGGGGGCDGGSGGLAGEYRLSQFGVPTGAPGGGGGAGGSYARNGVVGSGLPSGGPATGGAWVTFFVLPHLELLGPGDHVYASFEQRGDLVEVQFQSSPSSAPVTVSTSLLPAGLCLSGAVISQCGTTPPGVYPVTVTVSNGVVDDVSKLVTFHVLGFSGATDATWIAGADAGSDLNVLGGATEVTVLSKPSFVQVEQVSVGGTIGQVRLRGPYPADFPDDDVEVVVRASGGSVSTTTTVRIHRARVGVPALLYVQGSGSHPSPDLDFAVDVDDGEVFAMFASRSWPYGLLTIAATADGDFVPDGITLTDLHNGTAPLTGPLTRADLGVHRFDVVNSNVVGSARATATMTVYGEPELSGPAAITTEVGGAPIDITYTVTGYPVPTLQPWPDAPVPDGLVLTQVDPQHVRLTGSPTVSGDQQVWFAADSQLPGASAPGRVQFRIPLRNEGPPTITSPDQATFTVGQPGAFVLTATAFPALNRIELHFPPATGLPPGLDYDFGSRTIFGTAAPGTTGTYDVPVVAFNAAGETTQLLRLTIDGPPVVRPPFVLDVAAGQPNTVPVNATGNPTGWGVVGALPPGLTSSVVGGSLVFSGTPTEAPTVPAATYDLTVRASNAFGDGPTQQVRLRVTGPADHLVLLPGTQSIANDHPQVYSAWTADALGNLLVDVTEVATFSIDRGTCVDASGTEGGNRCSSRFKGDRTVTALFQELTGTAALNVGSAAAGAIALVLPEVVEVGEAFDIQMILYDIWGEPNPVSTPTALNTVAFVAGPGGTCDRGAIGVVSTCTPTAPGLHTIRISFGTLGAVGTFRAVVSTADHLVVSPAASSTTADEAVVYTAEAFSADGTSLGDVTDLTTFTMADGSCAANACHSTVPGDHLVLATFDTATGTAVQTVAPGAPASIRVDVVSSEVVDDEQVTVLRAVLLDAYGNEIADVTDDATFEMTGATCTGNVCTSRSSGEQRVRVESGDLVGETTAGSTEVTVASTLVVQAPDATATYGAVPATFTPTIAAPMVAGAGTAPTCTTTATSTSPVGVYPIVCVGGTDPDHLLERRAGTLAITAAPVVVRAPSSTMVAGDPVPPLTPTYEGLVHTDAPAEPAACTTGADGTTAGSFTVRCAGAADPNHIFTYADGTLDVLAAGSAPPPNTTTTLAPTKAAPGTGGAAPAGGALARTGSDLPVAPGALLVLAGAAVLAARRRRLVRSGA